MRSDSRTSIPCSVETRDKHNEFRDKENGETWDDYLQRIVPEEEMLPESSNPEDTDAVLDELRRQRDMLEKLVDVVPQVMGNVQPQSDGGASIDEIREAVRMEMREVLVDY